MRNKQTDVKRLLEIITGITSPSEQGNEGKMPLDVVAILALPENLRKTALAIHRLGRATAMMIARETRGESDVERMHLEQLVEMGYLSREKIAEEVYFYI